jgi:hypothetical protein
MSIDENSASLESIMRPLLEAANTELWRDSLNVLYLSGQVMAFSESFQLPCLISARGPYDEINDTVDLLKGKNKVITSELGKEFIPIIIPWISSFFRNEDIRDSLDEEDQSKFISQLYNSYSKDITKMQDEILQVIIQGASSISEMIIIELNDSLLEYREKMIRSAFIEEEYEEMITSLVRLKLIEPRLQIAICPDCQNYHILLSKTPTVDYKCPNCGEEWASVTLFTVVPPLNDIMKNNSDLPLFISSYLRYKIFSINPKVTTKIYPLSKQVVNDKIFDIDVYLPDYQTGIECKVFEDAYAHMTSSRLNSIVGSLIPQVQRYFDFGIQNVIIITNLVESSKNALEKLLKKRLAENDYLQSVEILHKDIDMLIKWLDEKAQGVTDQIMEDFAKSFESDKTKGLE